jgi:heat shock protein beta
MKAQTLGDNTQMEFMRGRRVLEINPNHPIVKDLNVSISTGSSARESLAV